MQTMECNNAEKVHDYIEDTEKIKGNIFVRNMANAVKYMNKTRLLNYRPVFLIRHPAETTISYTKLDPCITDENLCLEHQVEIYDWFEKILKEDPIIIDGNELRRDPSAILTQVCNRLDFPYTEKMLTWPVGSKTIDGIWAEAWYKDVHSSASFIPPSSTKITRENIPLNLVQVYHQALPYYE